MVKEYEWILMPMMSLIFLYFSWSLWVKLLNMVAQTWQRTHTPRCWDSLEYESQRRRLSSDTRRWKLPTLTWQRSKRNPRQKSRRLHHILLRLLSWVVDVVDRLKTGSWLTLHRSIWPLFSLEAVVVSRSATPVLLLK